MADHAKFAALAVRLIAKHGRSVTLRKLSGTAVDETKPWLGAGEPEVELEAADVPAVFLPASGTDLGRIVTNKELLSRVEQVALVAPNAVDLANMTVMLDGNVVWKIDWVQVLKPADQICLYVLGVCR